MNLDIPHADELFNHKPTRPPHPKIVAAYAKLSDTGRLAMELADRECARLLKNYCFFLEPITDQEIKDYARRYRISVVEAQAELRRLRDDS